jgi:3',5'-cyclic AMP phosphodiesterase CpdA
VSAVRIAHLTDVHWLVAPRVAHFSLKRVLGTANLYLRGRRWDFDERVQAEVVAHAVSLEPDLAIVTGDLTAQALPEEFVKAKTALEPLLERVPTVVVPGNHDMYAPSAVRDRLFHRAFERWSGRADPEALIRASVGHVTVLGLDPNRPTLLHSRGKVPEAQLEGLREALADPALVDRVVVLAIHYPLVDRHGHVYDNLVHGLENARALIAVLEAAPKRPSLVMSGHIHKGFLAPLTLSDGTKIPVANCGSSGLAHQPERGRAAAMGLYTVHEDGRVDFERWVHDGAQFQRESDGPFSRGAPALLSA